MSTDATVKKKRGRPKKVDAETTSNTTSTAEAATPAQKKANSTSTTTTTTKSEPAKGTTKKQSKRKTTKTTTTTGVDSTDSTSIAPKPQKSARSGASVTKGSSSIANAGAEKDTKAEGEKNQVVAAAKSGVAPDEQSQTSGLKSSTSTTRSEIQTGNETTAGKKEDNVSQSASTGRPATSPHQDISSMTTASPILQAVAASPSTTPADPAPSMSKSTTRLPTRLSKPASSIAKRPKKQPLASPSMHTAKSTGTQQRRVGQGSQTDAGAAGSGAAAEKTATMTQHGSGPQDVRNTQRYKTLSRSWMGLMIGLPLVIWSSFELYQQGTYEMKCDRRISFFFGSKRSTYSVHPQGC